jgi:hypothetical protein
MQFIRDLPSNIKWGTILSPSALATLHMIKDFYIQKYDMECRCNSDRYLKSLEIDAEINSKNDMIKMLKELHEKDIDQKNNDDVSKEVK